MLSALRCYLQQRPFASLDDIALHLRVEPEVARALIARWQAKGRIEALDSQIQCAGCTLCPSGQRERYRWVD